MVNANVLLGFIIVDAVLLAAFAGILIDALVTKKPINRGLFNLLFGLELISIIALTLLEKTWIAFWIGAAATLLYLTGLVIDWRRRS